MQNVQNTQAPVVFKPKKIKRSFGENFGYIIIMLILGLFAFSTIYPFWHIIMYSLSDSKAAMSGGLFFWPREFSLRAYEMVLNTRQIWIAYRNSILVTVSGTLLSLAISAITAYPLSRRRLVGRPVIQMLFFFTMLFGGGMIPTYLVVSSIGLLDTFWALIVPRCLSVYNMFILRNFMQSIPDSLEESARLDGANDYLILFRIMLPLCAPSLAAVAMFYGVGYWNSYMSCLLYTNNNDFQVLPLYLRNILSQAAASAISAAGNVEGMAEQTATITEETIKMTNVAVSVIPVLIVYPFLQRFYTKGITVGAVKG